MSTSGQPRSPHRYHRTTPTSTHRSSTAPATIPNRRTLADGIAFILQEPQGPVIPAVDPPIVYRGKGCTSGCDGAAPILTTSPLPASLTSHAQACLRRTLTRAGAPGAVRADWRSADESVHGR